MCIFSSAARTRVCLTIPSPASSPWPSRIAQIINYSLLFFFFLLQQQQQAPLPRHCPVCFVSLLPICLKDHTRGRKASQDFRKHVLASTAQLTAASSSAKICSSAESFFWQFARQSRCASNSRSAPALTLVISPLISAKCLLFGTKSLEKLSGNCRRRRRSVESSGGGCGGRCGSCSGGVARVAMGGRSPARQTTERSCTIRARVRVYYNS